VNPIQQRFFVIFFVTFSSFVTLFSQNDMGKLSGNFQMEAQYYNPDSIIGAPPVAEKILSNSFANIIYKKGNFTAGMRYEAYRNALLGYPEGFSNQSGIAYRFAQFSTDQFDVTVGNFFEQFGTGMIFRSYENRPLGFDNAMEGVRVKFRPTYGLEMTGLVGKNRLYFNLGQGIVRGFNVDANIGDMFTDFLPEDMVLKFGASAVSKFENPSSATLNLPGNVLATAARVNFIYDAFSLESEFAYKINDPTDFNNNTFNPGNGAFLQGTYVGEGYGVTFGAKRIDNMDMRSQRSSLLFETAMNFLPPLTKVHTRRLPTLYPYATQNNGEFGIQADGFFVIPEDAPLGLGGLNGTTVNVNYSEIHGLDTVATGDLRYEAEFGVPFFQDDKLYFRDINIDVETYLSKKVKINFGYIGLTYDQGVIESPGKSMLNAHTIYGDLSYTLARNNTIRFEAQHMSVSHKDLNKVQPINGSWVMGLVEYSLAPSFFLSAWNEYNYGNKDVEMRQNYYGSQFIYVKESNRLTIGYSRQRAGILCVGGVCRFVPASNGFSLSVTGSF
jgi:hypothetical protein